MMQFKKGSRTMRRVGVCLALASSMLVFAGPASAAEKSSPAYEYGHDTFSVYLTGDEVRYGGDREGRGFARLDFDPRNERVCYVITWRDLAGAVTDFDLRESSRRSDGPEWINFFSNERFNGDRRTVGSCVHSSWWQTRAVLDRPFDYYLSVRTTAYEAGAIRAQLY